MVEWCGGGVQYEYGYSTATVVREGVLLLLLCLSPPRLAGSGLAIPTLSCLPCNLRPLGLVRHWPLAGLYKAETHKTHRGQSALFRVPANG
jgi:hypothetical protein